MTKQRGEGEDNEDVKKDQKKKKRMIINEGKWQRGDKRIVDKKRGKMTKEEKKDKRSEGW